MLKKLTGAVLILECLASGIAAAQTSVGVSIGINQPGVYGRIDIGNYPPPVLVQPQPVIIVQQPVAVQRQPVYLYVPPGHQKNWKKHCHRYNACSEPVYFVQENWVRERYEYEQRHGHGERWDDDRGDQRGHGRDHDRGEHRGNRGHGNRRD